MAAMLSSAAFSPIRSGSAGFFLVFILLNLMTSGYGEDPGTHTLATCNEPLGMESGRIPDSAISASSSFDEHSVGPLNSRIRTERNGGAWCPKAQITKDVYEYLEIDLGRVKVITVVETQGRFGNGQGLEFAPHYMLEYQRQPGDRWIQYKDHHGQQVLEGNVNTYLAEKRVLQPPIIARRVRFIPYSVHPRTICMRVELHGCRGQGLLSYNMPQGQSRGAEVDLFDLTYDGSEKDHYLSGGLGQLTDGQVGTWNFRLDVHQTGHRGYEWIGWRNDSLNAGPVDIIFIFDGARNISAITVHCNNLFSKDIRVFRRAEVYTSTGRVHFDGQPVVFDYYRDDVVYHARNVTIPIPHLVADSVKLRLHFDARWMLISEVTFHSEPVYDNETRESLFPPPPPYPPPPNLPPTPKPPTAPGSNTVGGPSTRASPTEGIAVLVPADPTPIPPNVPVIPADKDHIPEVEVWPAFDVTSKGPFSSSSPGVYHDKPENNDSGIDDTYIGVIIGTLAALSLLMTGLVVFLIRRHKKKYSHSSMKTLTPDDLTYSLPNGKVANGNMYNAVATCDKEGGATGKPAPSNGHVVHQGSTHMLTNNDLSADKPYQVDSATQSTNKSLEAADNEANLSRGRNSPNPGSLVVSLPPSPVYHSTLTSSGTSCHHSDELQSPPPLPPPHGDVTNIQSWSGNSMYAVPNSDVSRNEDRHVPEFPRHVLKFVEKLGQGQFGEVHICEAVNAADFLSCDFLHFEPRSRSLLVAVKMLRPDASSEAKSEFHQEVRILSCLKDPNIVRVLGVCTQGEPLAVVIEYMKYGDLHQFLLAHIPDGTQSQRKQANILSYGCLIYMATQIASGMKYLETLNMVHRDLATRNCLVGHLYTVKISDFGMSRSLYSDDYCKIDGKTVLPIRWMAWESVLLGKFSCKSDVWSFAVTLWEVLTFAREQPFVNLSDDQVLENCVHCYHGDGRQVFLPQPPNCPKEIYDLMVECCHRDETVRPTFKEIHMFLSRKNMGYDPREEKPMRYALGYV